jgi:hypothetical protein
MMQKWARVEPRAWLAGDLRVQTLLALAGFPDWSFLAGRDRAMADLIFMFNILGFYFPFNHDNHSQ